MKSTREELQRHFDSVLDSAIDGIIVISDRGVIIEVNSAVEKLFGYAKREMVGSKINMLMPAPYREAHDQYVDNYLTTRKPKIIGIGREVEGLKKDGSTFPFRLAVGEVRMTDRLLFTGFVHDLTAEKEAQEKLHEYASLMEKKVLERTEELQKSNQMLGAEIETKIKTEVALLESQKLYEAIAVNFPNGTINVLDANLHFLFVEGSGLKEMGYGTKDLIGKSYLNLLDANIVGLVEEKLKHVFDGRDENFEIEINDLVFKVRAVPLPNEHNEIDRILLVETNITQQKKAEEEIFRSLQKEKELSELKSRFVSMASHEFRTPLSTILSSASLIERYITEDDQSKREKHTERIKGNVRNLTMILNDFLSLEKLDADKIRTNNSKIEICRFVQEIIDDLETLIKPGQSISLKCEDQNLELYSDKFMIQNILNNLISNAIKYSGNGKEIFLEIVAEADEVKIHVKDSGLGISKEDQQHIFNRFFRASNSGTEQGTGLGLHIVKRYLELLDGDISFTSELGVGSTFTISLKRTSNE